jgi:hypothetical protein
MCERGWRGYSARAGRWLYWNAHLYRTAALAHAVRETRTLEKISRAAEEARFKLGWHRTARLKREVDTPKTPPLIILGLYRSGTTLTASLVERLGVDLGPVEHRLAGIGRLKELNPDGFQENFMMNDLGRYILYHAGGSGARFPAFERLCALNLERLSDSDLAYYAEVVENDDRIDPLLRAQVLRTYAVSNINQYFCDFFDTTLWGFKDVHAGLYLPVYLRKWQGARLVVVFRHPAAFMKSIAKYWRGVTLDSWIEYYRRVLDATCESEVYWVCYEQLLEREPRTLSGLYQFVLGRSPRDKEVAVLEAQIRPDKAHHQGVDAPELQQALELYANLKKM